ncbi:MAG TPA: protein-disulfide reductase DsbD domain-containing protein, partial [Thermoanaerobaculia bacterium]|nr:protein-disulfide reductase DsbD domain-containing protein [Thermoanaerobaculia bacterium]
EWRSEAASTIASIRTRFRRKDGPGFTFSGEGNEPLLVNGRDLFDKATPSASGAPAWALARLALKTGDRELAREAREAVEEVSWLMARSPHGTESWFFALETLLVFDDRYGLLRLADTGEARRPAVGQGAGDSSSKVKESLAGVSPVRVEATAVEPKVPRGEKGSLYLRLSIAPGWHLQGPDGLHVEAWGGSEFTFEEAAVPVPSRLPDSTRDDETGWFGTVEATLSFFVSKKAAKGKKEIAVRVAHRACGEGACRPEEVLSLSVPIEVA